MSSPATEPDPSDLRRLLEAILTRSFQRGRFLLSSGAWSDFYLDLRRTTLDPDGLSAACAVLWPALQAAGVAAIGGPTLGADPLVAGLILEARRHGRPLQGFLVRGAAKDHGTGRQIEGHCPAGSRVAVIDDVVTRGGSILRAVDAVREAGAEAILALALVDRDEGGRTLLEQAGVPLYAPFRVSEVLAEAARRKI
jgi:orotate phosphoribosyltransferase